MTTTEALQLAGAAVFPLGLIALLLVLKAVHQGYSKREIAFGLAGVVTCLAGVIATGLLLGALRGGPLFDYVRGSIHFGSIGALDVAGLLVCATFLVVALRLCAQLMSNRTDDAEALDEKKEASRLQG